MRKANLGGANLTEADLREADLSYADLRDAKLGGADLREADLREARYLAEERVKAAKNWEQAHYSPEFRQQLGLPPETPEADEGKT